MDKEWSHIKNKHSDGIFTFGASFTVSVLVINILPFTLSKSLLANTSTIHKIQFTQNLTSLKSKSKLNENQTSFMTLIYIYVSLKDNGA